MNKIIEEYLEYLNGYPLTPILSCVTFKDKNHYYHDVDNGFLYTEEELIENVIKQDKDFMENYKGE